MPAAVGDDVLSSNWTDIQIYRYDGFSSTVTDTLDMPALINLMREVTMDQNGNLVWSVYTHMYKDTGFTETVEDDFAMGGLHFGISWNDTNLVRSDNTAPADYTEYTGFSNTIAYGPFATSRSGTTGQGIEERSFPLLNQVHNNWSNSPGGTDRWVGNVLQDTISQGSTLAYRGADWDGTNRLSLFRFASINTIRRWVGFTAVIDDDYTAQGGSGAHGLSHFVPLPASSGTRRQRSIKALTRSRRRRNH